MECFVIFVMAWCWFNATESKPHNVSGNAKIRCVNSMKKRNFRFKRELFSINGTNNIPGLIIISEFGYGFETYCCKNCGEIFVIDNELLFHKKIDVEKLCEEKLCPKCKAELKITLLKYPENILHDGKVFTQKKIEKFNPENNELIETYYID